MPSQPVQPQAKPVGPSCIADALHDVVNLLLVIGAESELGAREATKHPAARDHLDHIEYLARRASAISKGVLLMQSGAGGLRRERITLGRLVDACVASLVDMLGTPVEGTILEAGESERRVQVDLIRFRVGICVLAFCVLDGLSPDERRPLSIFGSVRRSADGRPWCELEFRTNVRAGTAGVRGGPAERRDTEERAPRGLGLSLVEEIVALHGGEVIGLAAASGVLYYVRLPAES